LASIPLGKDLIQFPLGVLQPIVAQQALQKLVLSEHLKLIDLGVDPRTNAPTRVFRLTEEGKKRLTQLRVSLA
jgi:hypothetical protein